MHQVIRERLEELLAGTWQPDSTVELHLEACVECRREVEGYRKLTQWMRTLRCEHEMAPAPGFYNRVWERVEARRRTSVWTALLDPAFAWRLAAGSLIALLLIGSFVLMHQAEPPEPAVTIIAVQEHPSDLGMDPDRDRQTVLVTLATYRE
jgi:anti-sigma factor RsiW